MLLIYQRTAIITGMAATRQEDPTRREKKWQWNLNFLSQILWFSFSTDYLSFSFYNVAVLRLLLVETFRNNCHSAHSLSLSDFFWFSETQEMYVNIKSRILCWGRWCCPQTTAYVFNASVCIFMLCSKNKSMWHYFIITSVET